MEPTREQDPAIVLCFFNDNTAWWTVQHSAHTDGETFETIAFEQDRVVLSTDTGREVRVPHSVYESYGEPVDCANHFIQELDSFGNWTREYPIGAPVVSQVPAFRG